MKMRRWIPQIASFIQEKFQKLPQTCKIDYSKNIKFYPKCAPQQWQKSGAKNLNTYRQLTREACGIASLQMALSFFKKNIPKPIPLIKEALRAKVLKPKVGLDLTRCPQFLKKFHIKCKVYHYLSPHKIASLLIQKKIIIASIKTEKGNHLILVSGVLIREHKPFEFLIHDSAHLKRKDSLKKIPIKKWQGISNHRGIALFESHGVPLPCFL